MPTALRAFLLLRAASGEWSVDVHRDLEGLIRAWEARQDPDQTAGVVHVGFDRPPTKAFDAFASQHPGFLLVTAPARFALPASFQASSREVGRVDAMPVYFATRGWGYTADDDSVKPSTPQGGTEFQDWLKVYVALSPDSADTLRDAEIFSEQSYLTGEARLPHDLRHDTGLFRMRQLIGEDAGDPCETARAAPPWLGALTFDAIGVTVRLGNVFSVIGINTVADLAEWTLSSLLERPNFGRKSVADLNASLERALRGGPSDVERRVDTAEDETLLAGVRRSLLGLTDRERDIVSRRMGLNGTGETLQQIADDYGITRERVRQIEAKVVGRLIRGEVWDDLLARKLSALLRDRTYPLPVMGVEAADSWFAGIAQYPTVLRYLLANMCESGATVIAIDGMEYFAFLSPERWETTLTEAQRLLASGTGKAWSEEHCRSITEGLLPEASREFRGLLWEKAARLCHFVDDGSGVPRLTAYGRGAEQIVEAVLMASDQPLHYLEIAQEATARGGKPVDVRRAHNAAASVGLLLGRGVYGLKHHLSLDAVALERLGSEAEEIVVEGPPGRQWHAAEILTALLERGSVGAASADKYVVDVALEEANHLERLGRMVWMASSEYDSEVSRIDVRQAIAAILQQAGRPLRAAEIRQRLIALRGVNQTFQIAGGDPLVRVGPALWGLNDRDLKVKRKDQPGMLEDLVAILKVMGEGVHASELHALVDGAATALPVEAVFSLATNDARLRVSQGQYLFLASWGEPRRQGVSEAAEAILTAAATPLAFDQIAAQVQSRVRRRVERTAISACLNAFEATLHADGRWSAPSNAGSDTDNENELAAAV